MNPFVHTKRVYFIISLLIAVLFFLLAVYNTSIHRDSAIIERTNHLESMARQLNITLSKESDSEIMQSIIDEFAASFANYQFGLYSMESGLLDYSGTLDNSLASVRWLQEQLRSHEEAGLEFRDHRGSILRVAYPLFLYGEIQGYTWADASTSDIDYNFNFLVGISASIILCIWVLIILILRLLMRRMSRSLQILTLQIQNETKQLEDLHSFPEILPILDLINRKNSDLKNLAHKYINEAYKMKQLMDMAPLGILSLDSKGTVNACNATYAQFHSELDNGRVLGMNIRALAEHSSIPVIEKHIEQALYGIRTDAATVQLEKRVFLVYAYPIYDDNHGISGSLGVCQDITEIETLRTELHRMDRLNIIGQMAASFAHEVRNPLTVIRGFMQLMQRQNDPPRFQQYLEMVISELDRSNEIIGNFLSLSQNRFIEKKFVSLNQIIEEIETLLFAEANHNNIQLTIHKDDELQNLELNDKEIKQLILNLARNGMESMDGDGKLIIRTMQEDDKSILEVQDTGHGISQDKLDHLFEPFYTTKPSGTGLGLSVCLSIVERHQAKISVDSYEGKGTTFTISFTCVEPQQQDISQIG